MVGLSRVDPFSSQPSNFMSELDHLLDKPEKPRRRWRWWKIAVIGLLLAIVLGGGGAAGILWYFSQDLPSLDPL